MSGRGPCRLPAILLIGTVVVNKKWCIGLLRRRWGTAHSGLFSPRDCCRVTFPPTTSSPSASGTREGLALAVLGDNIQREPTIITYAAVLYITSRTRYSTPPLPLFLSTTPSIHSKNHAPHDGPARKFWCGFSRQIGWQPYNSTLITSTSGSPAPYLNTPISTVSTSPPHFQRDTSD